jgi:cytidine deaminase
MTTVSNYYKDSTPRQSSLTTYPGMYFRSSDSLERTIKSVECSRPVSPMTLKHWNSLQSHMENMVNTRLARNKAGDVCTCIAGGKTHLHTAMTYEDTGSHIVPLSYGQNMARDNQSFHAEHNAIMKLRSRDTKKLMSINIFVLKTSMTGIIGNSKPCAHCLDMMLNLPPKKGYRISNILYTNTEGNIEKKKLTELMNDDIHISTLWVERGYKPRLKLRTD